MAPRVRVDWPAPTVPSCRTLRLTVPRLAGARAARSQPVNISQVPRMRPAARLAPPQGIDRCKPDPTRKECSILPRGTHAPVCRARARDVAFCEPGAASASASGRRAAGHARTHARGTRARCDLLNSHLRAEDGGVIDSDRSSRARVEMAAWCWRVAAASRES